MKKSFTTPTMMAVAATFAASLFLTPFAGAQEEEKASYTHITNVTIFDGLNEKTIKGSVLIENNLIKSVGADVKAPADATVIDGGGRFLMPGLIDGHVHFNLTGVFQTLAAGQNADWDLIGVMSTVNAKDYIDDGFTTVRDIGGMSGAGLKKAIDDGYVPGPRIFAGGAIISQSSGHADFRLGPERLAGSGVGNMERLNISVTADGDAELRRAVRRNFSFQASHIKICTGGGVSSVLDPLDSSGYSMGEIKAVVDEATRYNTYVAAHCYQDVDVQRSLEAGVMCIEHGHMMSEKSLKLLVEKGAFLVLNTAAVSPSLASHPNYAPSTPSGKKLKIALDGFKPLPELIKKYKPKLVHNVDSVLQTVESARNHRDHEKWVSAKMFGNFETLKAMTSTAGELMALSGNRGTYQDGKLGVIEPGAYADIILVDGNPLDDLACLGANEKWFDAEPREAGIPTIQLIMKDGKVYKNTINK